MGQNSPMTTLPRLVIIIISISMIMVANLASKTQPCHGRHRAQEKDMRKIIVRSSRRRTLMDTHFQRLRTLSQCHLNSSSHDQHLSHPYDRQPLLPVYYRHLPSTRTPSLDRHRRRQRLSHRNGHSSILVMESVTSLVPQAMRQCQHRLDSL